MNQTDLTLVNAGLALVGEALLATLDNTVNSTVISVVNEFLPRAKAACLRAHDWNSARKRRELSSVANDSLGEWAYAYRVPSDCLAVRRFVGYEDATRGARFAVELDDGDQRVIYCDVPEAKIVYTAEVLVVSLWDALLFDACATRLAIDFAGVFPRDMKFVDMMWKIYQAKIDEAVGVNESEGGQERLYSDSLSSVRVIV